MKALIVIPLGILLVAGAALGVLRGFMPDPPVQVVLSAAGVVAVAAEAALVPVLLARRSLQGTVAMAALGGTAVQMFVAISLAAVLTIAGLIAPAQRNQFLFWLLGLFWLSQVWVVMATIKAVRRAPSGAGAAPPDARPGGRDPGAPAVR